MGVRTPIGISVALALVTLVAFARFRAALQLEPNSSEIHFDLGISLAGLGRREEAVAQFSESLKLKPDYAKARDAINKLRSSIAQPAH